MTEPSEKSIPLRRRRETRWTVRVVDRFARALITLGGIGTIIAVSLVCVFLVWVVVPLFEGAKIEERSVMEIPPASAGAARSPVHLAVDEYQTISWALYADGTLESIRLDNGKILESKKPFEGQTLTTSAFSDDGASAAFGFADGAIRLGRIGIETSFLDPANAPPDTPDEVRNLAEGQLAEMSGGLVSSTPEGQLRLQKLSVKLEDPIPPSSPSPIILIDRVDLSSGPSFCAVSADGKLKMGIMTEKKSLISKKSAATLTSSETPLDSKNWGPPAFVLLSRLGSDAYVAWRDGHLVRFDVRDIEKVKPIETVDLVEPPGVTLTSLKFLIGRTTLLAGDSLGTVRAWFGVKPEHAETRDGSVLVAAHTLKGPKSPVVSLAASARNRIVAAAYGDGEVRLFYVTSGKVLTAQQALDSRDAVTTPITVAMAPKDDGFAAESGGQLAHWRIDLGHPEATLTALFRRVWYEGYEKPEHVWQSTGGTDDFEPKLGLMPLIFGTVKATVYSMLFGVPIALLGAIYTSQFLHPRFRSKIKPTVELMASLPSVVLGFLAALVFAPFVERALPAVLASMLCVPLSFLLAAYLWQSLPQTVVTRAAHYRFLFILGVFPLGILLAAAAGPAAEKIFFAGNFRLWLDGQAGGSMGGWMILFLPLMALGAAILNATVVVPWLQRISLSWSRAQCAAADAGLFIAGAVVVLAASLGVSAALGAAGFDLRGAFLGTYIQRNSLIVGFVMGFAIIPIIYTIADDAMSSVPEHLRSASLAAGATPWQTATRVIIPTAMSGLFSAIMIGLGRAVGETMIVLMAAGNTPLMEWNIFNGFRTLSANIAVELPEAVRGSTHYRTLFLAALTLFLMTFVLNTAAEMVRMRFRKRAYQL